MFVCSIRPGHLHFLLPEEVIIRLTVHQTPTLMFHKCSLYIVKTLGVQ